jgi:hypothetical protein
LNYKDQNFIIDKSLFDDNRMNRDILLDLYYHMPEEEYLIKDSLTIVFIPWG